MPSSKLTTLCAMLVASSTLVGCAAMVKTPYHAPAVQTPSSFQYDKTQVASNYANYADPVDIIWRYTAQSTGRSGDCQKY